MLALSCAAVTMAAFRKRKIILAICNFLISSLKTICVEQSSPENCLSAADSPHYNARADATSKIQQEFHPGHGLRRGGQKGRRFGCYSVTRAEQCCGGKELYAHTCNEGCNRA